MSVDGKYKEESRFPKSSLRARSKTVMMEPSKLDEFRADSLWQDADMLHVDDLLEDNMPVTDEVETAKEDVEDSSLGEHEDMVGGVSEEVPEAVEPESLEVESSVEEDIEEEFSNIVADPEEPSQLDSSGYEDFLEEEGSEAMQRDAEFEDEYERVDDDFNAAGYRDNAHRDGAHIVWRRQTRLIGFLVALDEVGGEQYVELHEGRLLISSEQNATENCLVISHPSVSTMHAIMRISSDGSILILDQLSEHGTTIKRASDAGEQSLMGDKEALHHGDVVVFGECAYNVCIIDFGVSKVDA